jgi:hypothetical protein
VSLFLLVEAIAFALAALVHAGTLAPGYEHRAAMTAESVIGTVLVLGLAATAIAPQSSRAVGLAAQGFALLGTCVGIITIILGVGPQSAFDLVLHAGFVTLLMVGLVVTVRGVPLSRP